MVVIAIEHRDGSGPMVMPIGEETGKPTPKLYLQAGDLRYDIHLESFWSLIIFYSAGKKSKQASCPSEWTSSSFGFERFMKRTGRSRELYRAIDGGQCRWALSITGIASKIRSIARKFCSLVTRLEVLLW